MERALAAVLRITALSGAAVGVPARQDRNTRADKMFEVWLSAVEHHTPGRLDEAAASIATWSRRDLTAALDRVKRDRLETDPNPANRILIRAAFLHADIAVLHRTARGYTLPSDDASTLVAKDGRQLGRGGRTVHWDMGRKALDAVLPDPAREDRVRLWYQTTAAILQYWDEFAELEPHLARARQLFPRDAALLVVAGTMHEYYAESVFQNFMADLPGGGGQARRSLGVGSTSDELTQAESLFRRALETDPDRSEARIRLAHVLGREARHAEAAAELRQVLSTPLSPLLKHYGLLFLGREEQALGRPISAREAFEGAAALYPDAQSPRLALSELAHDAGDRVRARELLPAPGAATKEDSDPWRRFHRMHEQSVDELMAAFRRIPS